MESQYKNTDDGGAGIVPNELITQKELARRLHISDRKIQGDKKLPRVQYGRNVRYSWPAVLAYLGEPIILAD